MQGGFHLSYLTGTENIYEGNEPYLFISYSHKDHNTMLKVKHILDNSNIRCWYDNGLHSGDDWNMVIAEHLKNSSVCLLLLSPNSANSEYVKNELNFAMNHRIPIHTLLIEQFVLPLDIEMMTGRIQMITMADGYQEKLIKSLPYEIFCSAEDNTAIKDKSIEHPLFSTNSLLSDKQGTRIFSGEHKRLKYKCLVLEEQTKLDELGEVESRICLTANIKHRLFPVISDFYMGDPKYVVYQEFFKFTFLYEFLSQNHPDESTIIRWMTNIVDGIKLLYSQNLVLRDFARGSLLITDDNEIKIIRLHNSYYGVLKITEETKKYYFEKTLQEIAILFANLVLCEDTLLPIRIITTDRFKSQFLQKVNIIIQKCVKEDGRTYYHNFDEILLDLQKDKFSGQDKVFLKKRSKKLKDYDTARQNRKNDFTSNDRINVAFPTQPNLEKEFGFDETVVLANDEHINTIESSASRENINTNSIQVMICSSGEVLTFNKSEIYVGREKTMCDMIWTQPYFSRTHFKIKTNGNNTYTITDLNSTNGVFVIEKEGDDIGNKIPSGEEIVVEKDTILKVGHSAMQLL